VIRSKKLGIAVIGVIAILIIIAGVIYLNREKPDDPVPIANTDSGGGQEQEQEQVKSPEPAAAPVVTYDAEPPVFRTYPSMTRRSSRSMAPTISSVHISRRRSRTT